MKKKARLRMLNIQSTFTPRKDVWDLSDVNTKEDLMIKAMQWRKEVLSDLLPSPRIKKNKFYLNEFKS